jgi:hypothetical protein
VHAGPVAPPPVLGRLQVLIATASKDAEGFLAELAKRLGGRRLDTP